MGADKALLQVDDLECVRDGRVLFSQLQLRLDPGQVVSLEGANGAGKSTLLRCIAGLYPDYSGEISSAPLLYCGHKPGMCGQLSTIENLRFLSHIDAPGATPSDVGLNRAEVNSLTEALESVGLAGYESVRCASLSAGQLRRVGLARLLVSRAPLWLLDEPLTALDKPGSRLLGRVLAQHVERGGSAVCATHQTLPFDNCITLDLASVATVAAPDDASGLSLGP